MKYLIALCLVSQTAFADSPVIENVAAHATPGGWRFDVTISHPDTGWNHYADGWRVLDENGNELGMRVLHHPHETEQPFTRSLNGVQIPEGTTQVQIQARCLIDGWNEETAMVPLQ